jgi:hypothetical protein
MAKYTANDLHVDRLLTNISIGYGNSSYIADQILPVVRVGRQSDKYVVYDKSHWFRNEARLRAPGTASQRGGWTYSNAAYYCDRFSFGHEIYDADRANADDNFALDREATEFVADKILMQREVSAAAKFFTTGVWGLDRVGTTNFTQWSDYANSNPLSDIGEWMDSVEASIGREPNTLVLGKQAWLKLKWHPDLIDTIKYTQRAQMTVDLAAALFEVQRILIGRAIYTNSPEGTAEGSVAYSRIWGKNALLLYVPPAPGVRTPAAGYTFVWDYWPNALMYIKRMRDEQRETDIIEGNSFYAQVVTGAAAGVFASAAVA